MLQFYREAMKRAFPVYLPVYLIPMLLFRRKQLLSQPISTLRDNALGMARSTLFLASYCTMGMYEMCWLRRTFGVHFKTAIALSGKWHRRVHDDVSCHARVRREWIVYARCMYLSCDLFRRYRRWCVCLDREAAPSHRADTVCADTGYAGRISYRT